VDDHQSHMYCTNKFIELANELKNEKIDNNLVNGALMSASGIYATFIAAGNRGLLEPSGIEKVVNLYRRTLENYQADKKAQMKKQAES
jgi:hypothetical protein